MKTLVVYYSLTCNNQLLAFEIQKTLHCDVLRIEEVRSRTKFTILLDRVFTRLPRLKPYKVEMSAYDHVIFICPIWASRIATPLKAFLLRERNQITRYSFISLCGGQPGQKEKVSSELEVLTQKEPEKVSELALSEVIPKEKLNDVRNVIDFRITPELLQHYRSVIDNFLGLKSCNQPATGTLS